MPTENDPIVGNWYENSERGQKFEVVALDEDNGLVDIQYFDGDLDEIDLDTWYELDIAATEAPDDWTGPVDDIKKDDIGLSEPEPEEEEALEVAAKPRRSRRTRLSDEFDELDQDEEDESDDEFWEDET